MATLEDIVAATKILAQDSETLVGVSASKPEDSQATAFDLKKVDGSAAAVVSKRVVETETVVETAFDNDSGLERGLGYQGKDKNGVENLSSVGNGGTNALVNGTGIEMGVNGSSDGVVGRNGSNDKQCNGNGINDVDVDLDGGAKGEGACEQLKNQEHGFLVGDFVWGKIKSHPWWPGQVYDPIDASEFAVKHGQEGRLLVAFFGDGSCSWCMPSQLIPFVDNFEEMSKDSSSKSFLYAVQRALEEIGRLVESEMTCKCIPEEKKVDLARPVVANAGVKAGVLMPEVNVHRLSLTNYEPTKLIAKLKHFAEAVSTGNAIELAVLSSWLSAFYRFKGGHPRPLYHEPFHIEGLEDKNNDVAEVTNDFSVPIEVPILGPLDDDWVSSPAVGIKKSEGYSDDKIYHRRKQKSVAELMGENTNVKPKSHKRATLNEETDLGKSESAPKRNKSSDGVGEGVSQKASSSTKKLGSKRKVEVALPPKLKSESVLNAKNGCAGGGDHVEEGRKVEVALSPKLKSESVLNAKNGCAGGVDHVEEGSLLGKPEEIEVSAAENTSGEAKEESEVVTTPRERKKSKYLSPPYTNLALRIGNSSFKTEIESDKITKVARVGERMTKAAGDLFASPSILKSFDKASEEKLSDEQPVTLDTSVNTSSHTVQNDKMTFSVSDVNTSVNILLSEIQVAALDPLYLSKKGSLDMVWDFVSALRSSTYLYGSNYKIYRKCKTGNKRKSLSTQLRNIGSDLTQKNAKSTDLKPLKPGVLKTEEKSSTSKSGKAAETSIGKINAERVEEKTSPPRLILTFTREFPLPSKDDIMNLFNKFGSLNEKETKVVTDSHSVQIVYIKDCDAEAAFKSSVSQSPFGFDNVNYRLQHSRSKSRGSRSKVSSSLEQTPNQPCLSHPADELMSDVGIIKQKFEIMTAILENYQSKFSSEDKSILKNEMKHLMEKVETVSEKVRIMAEKTSS